MDRKSKYEEWINRAIDYIAKVGPIINMSSGCTQAKPFFDKQAEIMFVGINPAESYGWVEKDGLQNERNRFIEGNICRPEEWAINPAKPAHAKWNWIFNPENAKNSFNNAKWSDVVMPGNYLFYNLYMFGSKGTSDLNYTQMGVDSIMLISELITEILQPKRVICLSTTKVFNPLKAVIKFENVHCLNVKRLDGSKIGFNVWRGDKDGIIFYGINHISWTKLRHEDFNAAIKAIKDDKI